jgi:hypothetical protein
MLVSYVHGAKAMLDIADHHSTKNDTTGGARDHHALNLLVLLQAVRRMSDGIPDCIRDSITDLMEAGGVSSVSCTSFL